MSRDGKLPFPGHHSPDAGFEAPFEMLEACHDRVRRMFALLARVRQHLDEIGWEEKVGLAARDVLRYFEMAAPNHHLDEELHVFPAVLTGPDADLQDIVRGLHRDHLDMLRAWPAIRQVLQSIANSSVGQWVPLDDDAKALLDLFASLYARHVEQEDLLIYPASRRLLSVAALNEMSRDMRQRRGVAALPEHHSGPRIG